MPAASILRRMTGSATPQIPATSRILVTYYLTQGSNGILAAIHQMGPNQSLLFAFYNFPNIFSKLLIQTFLILNCNWRRHTALGSFCPWQCLNPSFTACDCTVGFSPYQTRCYINAPMSDFTTHPLGLHCMSLPLCVEHGSLCGTCWVHCTYVQCNCSVEIHALHCATPSRVLTFEVRCETVSFITCFASLLNNLFEVFQM